MRAESSRRGSVRAILMLPVALASLVVLTAAGMVAGYGSAMGIAHLGESLAREKEPAEEEGDPVAQEVILFDDWPEAKPQFVLVVTGETLGYMRPCGCSEGQSGGLARRPAILEYLKSEKGFEPVPIDFGELVKAEKPWDKIRYPYIIQSLRAIGYKVVGIGAKDLSLGASVVSGEALNSDPLSMLSANVQSQQDDFNIVVGEFILPMKMLDVAGQKVAVGSLIGESMKPKIADQSVDISPSATDAATKTLDQMNAEKAAFKVLLAHMSPDEAAELAKMVPGFDVVVSQSLLEHPQPDDVRMVGETMVAWAGQKGLDVVAIGYWPDEKPRLRFEVIPVTDRYKDNEELNDIYARYVQRVWDDEYLAKLPRLPHSSGAEYLGSQQCGACHPKAFETWKGSKHSHALVTLEDAKPEGQHYNPECVQCHVVGFERKSGFVTPDTTPALGGVGCENCHGPGSKHVSDPMNEAYRAAMRTSKNAQDCRTCHDSENSIHFNFDTYWPKIAHPGKEGRPGGGN